MRVKHKPNPNPNNLKDIVSEGGDSTINLLDYISEAYADVTIAKDVATIGSDLLKGRVPTFIK